MKKLLLFLTILSVAYCTDTITDICYKTYRFPNCAKCFKFTDVNLFLVDDIQVRLYHNDTAYTLFENFTISDSLLTFDKQPDIDYLYGKIYLIYYGSRK